MTALSRSVRARGARPWISGALWLAARLQSGPRMSPGTRRDSAPATVHSAPMPGLRRWALALATTLGGCGDDVGADPSASEATTAATEATPTDPTTESSSGGETACADAGHACGARAHCDPVDQQCYCDPGAYGDPYAGCVEHGNLCGAAGLRTGKSVCVHELTDAKVWESISVGYAKRADVRKLGKYVVPATADAPMPTLFNDANNYRLHYCMLSEGFEPQFPNFTQKQYNDLVYFRADRKLFAGNIYEFSGADAPVRFGFTVETPTDPSELITEQEAYHIYRHIQDRLSLGDVGYVPNNDAQKAAAAAWEDPQVKVVVGGDDNLSFEVYTPGLAYGRLRSYTDAEIPGAAGTFGWQDILLLESAPSDLGGVMAGVITGARQDVLSHLNVLASRRGTPNVFVADPFAAFASKEGKLVRLSVSDAIYAMTEADLAEAEAFWAAHRPSAPVEHLPDPDFLDLVPVLQIPTATAIDRDLAVGRFGGKVTGLATLYATLDPVYQTQAFGVPGAHYQKFMQENTWELVVAGEKQTLSFADTIALWLADPAFRSDTALRKSSLLALSAAMIQRGEVDPELLTALRARIGEVFGADDRMVRLRSSSNAEDGLVFNGAGLYTSESGCALDPDGKTGGHSACDADKDRRPLDLAIKTVWASLWSFGAFEEREYYQMNHTDVVMGVLVSGRHEDERANGVAFTGNPSDPEDPRFTINVQLGELDVVSPQSGTTAELDRLTIADGEVVAIDRVGGSSLVKPGERVLSDEQLGELGAVLAAIAASYPVDLGEVPASDVLLDLEFKIDAQGKLVIKQIRPFLRTAVDPSLPSCL